MKKFQFPLEKLLHWRATQAELEKGRLGELFRDRNRMQTTRRTLLDEDRRAHAALLAEPTATGADLAAMASFHSSRMRAVAALDKQLRDAEARIEAQRRKVVEADRARRLIERLKERSLEEWKYEFNRELENNAGESFLAGWVRTARAQER